MNDLRCVLFVVVSVFFSQIPYVKAYDVAGEFSYPLAAYYVPLNDHGTYNAINNQKYHIGEDGVASAGTKVFAIGEGVVKWAKYHAPKYDEIENVWRKNYGGLYIIEHTLVEGIRVCSLYAHLNFATFTKEVGDPVKKGEYIGEIGNYSQNGNFPEHIHFGIRKGSFPLNPNAYICNDWIFSGYTVCVNILDEWEDPSEFMFNYGKNTVNVIKFSDSPSIYLFQNHKLFPINDATAYAKLGFSLGCESSSSAVGSTNPNWNYVIEIPASEKPKYDHLIYSRAFPTQGSLVRIVDKVGPNTCLSRTSNNPGTLYAFDCGKFRPFFEWDVCRDFGYTEDDIVDITQELFNEYGEWWPIYEYDNGYCFPQLGGGDWHEEGDECFPFGFEITTEAISSSQIKLSIGASYGEACTCIKPEIYQNGVKLPNDELLSACDFGFVTISDLNFDTEYCFGAKLFARKENVWQEVGIAIESCQRTLEESSGYGAGFYEPEDLQTSVINPNQINLFWDRGLNSVEYGNLDYRIYRDGNYINMTYNDTITYSDTGLESNTRYCYRISVFKGSIESELSNEVCAITDNLPINIPPSDDYTINRSTICKDADMNSPYLPINETTSFTINNSSETSVHAWIQLDNISKRIRIDWYWYDADGRKVESDYAFLGKDGSLYGWWRDFCNCLIYNTKSFGKWKVQIYIEEELAITDYFYVNVNLTIPQNLNLSYNKELRQVNSTWNAVDLAESYRIYRNGNTIQETNNLYYTDTGIIPNNSYTYKIIAIRGNRTSSFSDGVTVDIPADEILPPVIKEISIQ